MSPRAVLLMVVTAGLLAGPARAQTDRDGRCSLPVARWNIPSGSMLPTLPVGGVFWSVCLRHAVAGAADEPGLSLSGTDRMVRRGDIVVFRHRERGVATSWIKRVTGLPGDRVEVVEGRLRLNGETILRTPLPEWRGPHELHELVSPSFMEVLPGGKSYAVLDGPVQASEANRPPSVVPPGRIYVTGDNRPDSMDSRFPGFGTVGFDDVTAVVVLDDGELEDVRDDLAASSTLPAVGLFLRRALGGSGAPPP